MSAGTIEQRTAAVITEIKEKLGVIEEHMAWLIRPDQRFSVGQRVEWSRKGRRRGFPHRKIAQRGTVKAMGGFCLTVLLDGYKQPSAIHHSFFNPVSGPKLF